MGDCIGLQINQGVSKPAHFFGDNVNELGVVSKQRVKNFLKQAYAASEYSFFDNHYQY